MTEYKVDFFTDDEEGELVFTLDIKGGSRTDLIYNIVFQEWDQSGYFTVDEEDWEEILWDFLTSIFKDPPTPSDDSYEYSEFLYNLGMLCEYKLNIRGLLEETNLEITEEEILNKFCELIVSNFEYSQSTFNPDEPREFSFEVEKL
jgi:hypothetical protein